MRHLLGESFELTVDGIRISSSVHDRYYLLRLTDADPDGFTAELFKATIRPGMVVCDIGAFVGYYSLLAAQRVGSAGKVYAFEPDRHSFGFLVRNIQTNGFADIVTAVPKAISNVTEEASFYFVDGNRRWNSLLVRGVDVTRGTVSCTKLDEFLQNQKRVDVIKIDIEGAEVRALEGMERTLARSPHVIMIVECHPQVLGLAGYEPRALVDRLEALGFGVSMIDEESQSLAAVDSRIESANYMNLYCQRRAIHGRMAG